MLPQPQKQIHPPIFITILLIVAGLIGSFQIYSSYTDVSQKVETKDQVTDWKTYKNDRYGYEIKYPSNWFIPINDPDGVTLSTASESEIEHGLGIPVPNNIWVDIVNSGKPNCEGVEITNGFESQDMGAAEPVYFKTVCHGGVLISLGVWSSDPQLESHKKVLDQVLSTFKFISTSSNQGILPYQSGVEGRVSIGPTCPVERIPPDPQCSDKPYQATLIIKNGSGHTVINDRINLDGSFKFALPPGNYIVENGGKGVMPTLSPTSFTVGPNKYTEVNLTFDSGIR